MATALSFSDQDFLTLFNLKELSDIPNQIDLTKAKSSLLDHYNNRVKSNWLTSAPTINDLAININELRHDELVAQAESILNNRFSVTHMAPNIFSDGAIDWTLNPSSDPELLWELNRHQWWTILGHAYAKTQDERYAAAFVTQMVHWVETCAPPPRMNETSPTWRLMEVALRMRTSWIPAFGLFYGSPSFTNEAKLLMLRSIYDHAEFLSRFSTKQNHLLRESNGLAYVSVYFPEFNAAKKWQQIALARLDQELTKQVNLDGSQIEISIGYQWLVVDEYESTFDLLRTHQLSLPKENLSSWLEKMYSLLAYVVRPDGSFSQLNDGFIQCEYTRLALAGKKFNRDDFLYIGTAGEQGTLPEVTSKGFDNAGFFVMRSDWSKEARYLLFSAGPFGGHHGHEDKLSFELFAFNQPFIVDSGSYTYNKKDPFRTYFVGSQGHNTILVDGQSQIRRWHKEHRIPKPSSGNHATWVNQINFDYVVATYNDGYSHYSLDKPRKDPEIITDVTHTRHLIFVKPDYWIMVDEIHAEKPHDYQLLFHTPPGITATERADKRMTLRATQNDACLTLIPLEPNGVKIRNLTGSETPIQGWYSARALHKTPTTTVIYEQQNSASTIITTLLYPVRAGEISEKVSIKSLSVSDGQGLAFVVTTHLGCDYIMLSQNNNRKKFGKYESNGNVAGVRTDKNCNILTKFEYTQNNL
jgi:hypothetical protein